MLLSELRFGALLAYSPRGSDAAAASSRRFVTQLKRDRVNAATRTSFSVRLAHFLARHAELADLLGLFGPDVCLVPVPRRSQSRPGTLWVPLRLAVALRDAGLAGEVLTLLRRTQAVPKSATSAASARPLAGTHAESLGIDAQLLGSSRLLLIDDVVTRGATMLGAASRLRESYPSTPIAAFAAMRTISSPADFRGLLDPVVGQIVLRPQGDTLRRP
jgi:hypothetical protein